MMVKKIIVLLFFVTILFAINPPHAHAYIGPGAGFAFLSSFLVVFLTILLAIITLLVWPVRFFIKTISKKNKGIKSPFKKVVILGLDGFDPDIAKNLMEKGKLPNLSKLKDQGVFKPLRTTLPAMSPVAWSSFITGVDPSRHNIFDFLNRDPKTYVPCISSVKIGSASKIIKFGKYCIPLGKPQIKSLRKSLPFWNILSKHDIFSSIIRVPITFPPEKVTGVLLSAMCVPDLKGSQGTFVHYTSEDFEKKHTGGKKIHVKVEENKVESYIEGPENPLTKSGKTLKIPFTIKIDTNKDEVKIKVNSNTFKLKKGEYSPWIKLTFKLGLGMKVRGICRFLVLKISPHFELYLSPVNIDPGKPALPISYPFYYSMYLAKLLGNYATLGLAEDTWALNERVIDEKLFLDQVYKNHDEREQMFFNALDKTKKGFSVCVFDTPDRTQHMFMRYLDEKHPANLGKDIEIHKNAIEEMYIKMDNLAGKVIKKITNDDVFMVMSDHGFKQFKRGVNLNTWLRDNGYLYLKDDKKEGGEWFADVDWARTKAYVFGLSGIYINLKGREGKGIVSPGNEENELKKEIIGKIKGLEDMETGNIAITEAYDTSTLYSGPYVKNGPDVIIGFNVGYRSSWGAAIGITEEKVFKNNNKSWSGDHCMDSRHVPGVFFCNKSITANDPGIEDIAPTVLSLFGVEIPKYMTGKPLMNNHINKNIENI